MNGCYSKYCFYNVELWLGVSEATIEVGVAGTHFDSKCWKDERSKIRIYEKLPKVCVHASRDRREFD